MASYTLQIQYTDRPTEVRGFDQPQITIGRDVGDIALHDGQVSGRHAEITFDHGKLVYKDLGSTNGSFRADGQRIFTAIELAIGQSIRLGQSTITVQSIDAAQAAGPKRTMLAGPGSFPPRVGGLPAPGGSGGTPPPAGSAAPASPWSTGQPTAVQARGSSPLPSPTGHGGASQPSGGYAPPPPSSGPYAQQPSGGYAPPPPSSGPYAQQPSGAWGHAVDQVGEAVQHDLDRVGTELDALVAQGPASDEMGDQVKYYLAFGASVYKARAVDGAMIFGVLLVPVAILSAILGLIPLVGWVLALLLAIAQAVASPVATASLGRWAVAAASGKRLGWAAAWRASLAAVGHDWPNVFVASLIAMIGFVFLIIPGILLGAFMLPIFLLEDRKFIGINLRNLDLAKDDLVRIVVVALATFAVGIPVFVVIGVLGWILGHVPIVGVPLSTVINAVLVAAFVPFGLLTLTKLYFDVRRKVEGYDATGDAHRKLESWERGLVAQPLPPFSAEHASPPAMARRPGHDDPGGLAPTTGVPPEAGGVSQPSWGAPQGGGPPPWGGGR